MTNLDLFLYILEPVGWMLGVAFVLWVVSEVHFRLRYPDLYRIERHDEIVRRSERKLDE